MKITLKLTTLIFCFFSVINLAQHENLEGHANSIKIRLKGDNWLAKQETLEFKGKVTELLPNAMFRVKL